MRLDDADELLSDSSAESTVTETLGPDSFAVLLPAPHLPGELAEVSLETPGGSASAWCAVTDVRPVRVGGRTLHAHRIAFRKYADEGRGVIGGIVHRSGKPGIRRAVRLSPEKQVAPVLRPVAAAGGVATLAAGVLLSVGLLTHRDDYLMTSVAATGEAGPAELVRLNELLADMQGEETFDEPRVLRLRNAFTAVEDAASVAGLNELLVAHSPKTPVGRFRRAESLMNLGRYAEADGVFADLLTVPEEFEEERTRRELAVAAGRNAAHLRQWGDAADRFEKYVVWGGPVEPVRSEWAGLLAQAGRPEKAVRVLTALGEREPGEMSKADRHLLAPMQLVSGDAVGAAETYRSLLAEDPGDSAAGLGLARVALDSGEAGATEAFRMFLAEHPDDPDARLGLAQSLLAEGEPVAAEEALRALLEAEPDHPALWPAYLSMLDALPSGDEAEAGDAAEAAALRSVAASAPARDRLVRAIVEHRASRPGDGPFLLQMIGAARRASAGARSAAAQEDWRTALHDLRTDFVALPGVTPAGRLRRAEALADLGREDEAGAVLVELAKELAADPFALPDAADRRGFHLAAARSEVRAKHWTAAAEHFSSAVAEGADPAAVRAERAGVEETLGRPGDGAALLAAGTIYDSSVHLADLDRSANNGPDTGFEPTEQAAVPPLTRDEAVQLGGLWAADDQLDAAAGVLSAVVADHPGDIMATRLLADVTAGRGRFLEAARLYETVVSLDPAADAADGDAAATRAGLNRFWGADAAGAERTFRTLLAADGNRPDLWTPYLEAADAVPAPPGEMESRRRVLRAIVARRAARATDGPFLLRLIGAAAQANARRSEPDHRRDRSFGDRSGDDWPALLRDLREEYAALPANGPVERLRRAEVLADLGRDAEAAAALHTLAVDFADDPATLPDAADRRALHLASARADVRADRLRSAADRYAAAIAEGTEPWTVRAERAGVLANLGRPAEAAALLAAGTGRRQADPFAPMSAQPRVRPGTTPPLSRDEAVQLGGLWAAADELNAAADVLTGVVDEFPADREATKLLADVSAGLGRFADAARLYGRVVDLDPAADRAAGRPAATQAAYNRLWSGDAAGAEAAFRRLLAIDFSRTELWTPYLEAAGGTKNLPDAAGPLVDALYARRTERAADDRFLTALVAAAHRDGRADRVVALLRVLTDKEDTPRELLIWLADSLQQQGKHEEAARIYARLLRTASAERLRGALRSPSGGPVRL